MSDQTVVMFVDTSWLVYRSYYAHPTLSVARGNDFFDTGVMYGLVVAARTMRKRYPNGTIYWCLDSDGPTEKRKKYPWYKANRKDADRSAWDLKDELLRLMASVPNSMILQAEGHEADEVIATMVRLSNTVQPDWLKVVFASDKDLLQLLAVPNTAVVSNLSEGKYVQVTEQDVLMEWGVLPERMLMLRSILGDPGDCIPRLVPRMKSKLAATIAMVYQDPPSAWLCRPEFAALTKKELTEEMYARWLANYELTALADVPLVKLKPEPAPLSYWVDGWELNSAKGVIP